MIRLVTVIGHGVGLLPQFIQHYKNQRVDEINIVVYKSHLYPNIEEEVVKMIRYETRVKIVKSIFHRVFDWEKVTQLYNEIKSEYPDDWWVVADIDEFHLYPHNDLWKLIKNCDTHGWDIVRGGFIDRVGIDGNFSAYRSDIPIFQIFPLAGFFRYPMSKACPNKICVMKGYVEITPGQHYAKIDGHTTWRWQGWNHPLIAPYDEYSVQVHHFKWDSTAFERLLVVAQENTDYSFSNEYQLMYDELKNNNFKIDTTNKEYMFERCDVPNFHSYRQWNKLINKIVSI